MGIDLPLSLQRFKGFTLFDRQLSQAGEKSNTPFIICCGKVCVYSDILVEENLGKHVEFQNNPKFPIVYWHAQK